MSDNLSVLFWNIDGAHYIEGRSRFSKLDDEETQTVLGKHDIVCLAETHCSCSDLLHLPGYTCHMNIRPKSPSARKHSGGISVLIKDQIRPGITYMPITNSEFVWLRLDKKISTWTTTSTLLLFIFALSTPLFLIKVVIYLSWLSMIYQNTRKMVATALSVEISMLEPVMKPITAPQTI